MGADTIILFIVALAIFGFPIFFSFYGKGSSESSEKKPNEEGSKDKTGKPS